MMNGMMQKMMLSCKKTTELVEKNSVVGLAWNENIQLKMHMMMCTACKKYESQSKIIDLILEKINANKVNDKVLSQEVKTKILIEIEKK